MQTEDAENQAKGFALRLRETLQQKGKKTSPTALEREFNLRYRGQPITMHAARKWLLGLALPTQDKLEVLARWLDVPIDWLRWGSDCDGTTRERTSSGHGSAISAALTRQNRTTHTVQEESSLLQDWRLLEPRNQQLVKSIIELLLRDQHESRLQKAK